MIASFYGMAKHADCIMLFNKLTGKEMKSFKDLNVAYKPEDGKKRFAGAVVSIRELVNLPIVVKDFEVGVKTSQGEDRCVVSIEQNGEPKKFFTNSEEMKNILQQGVKCQTASHSRPPSRRKPSAKVEQSTFSHDEQSKRSTRGKAA